MHVTGEMSDSAPQDCVEFVRGILNMTSWQSQEYNNTYVAGKPVYFHFKTVTRL